MPSDARCISSPRVFSIHTIFPVKNSKYLSIVNAELTVCVCYSGGVSRSAAQHPAVSPADLVVVDGRQSTGDGPATSSVTNAARWWCRCSRLSGRPPCLLEAVQPRGTPSLAQDPVRDRVHQQGEDSRRTKGRHVPGRAGRRRFRPMFPDGNQRHGAQTLYEDSRQLRRH